MDKQSIINIKQELLKNIKCESCGDLYALSDVSLKNLGGNKSIISAKCKKCGSLAEFEAEIMEQEDVEQVYEKEIADGNFKTLEGGKAVDYRESEFAKEFEEIKKEKKKDEDISNSVIKNEEIEGIVEKMNNFSSFKNLFSLVLMFGFSASIFVGCADTAEENRQNILNSIESAKTQINMVKDQAQNIYNDGKEKIDQVKKVLDSAPEKIQKTKEDIDKITSDAIKLKKDLEKKAADAKKAIDETKKAVDAVSNAMDSINAITGNNK